MRRTWVVLFLLAGCGKATPPPAPAARRAPEAQEAVAPSPREASLECPLSREDLLSLGFPKDVQATDFGSTPDKKKFSVRSDTLGVMLLLELESYGTSEESLRVYGRLREAQGTQKADPKDEDRYGQKSFRSGPVIAFLKGSTLGQITVGAAPGREPKEEELLSILHGAARQLSR